MKIFVNALTLIRLLATFILPICWNTLFQNPIVLLIFVGIILLTDFFDGFLARRFKVSSFFGMIADVLADKMFGIMLILILAKYQPLFYLELVIELAIMVVNISAGFLGAKVKSSFLGKTKMWFLGISSMFGLLSIFDKQLLDILNNKWLIDKILLFMDNESTVVISSILICIGTEIMVIVDYSRHIFKDLKKNRKRLKYDFKSNEDLKEALFDHDFYVKHKDEPISKAFLK